MTATPCDGVGGGAADRPGQDAPAGLPASPTFHRARWQAAVLASPDLTATRRVQALRLAVLMTSKGELERHAATIGARIAAPGQPPLSRQGTGRLLSALVSAGLLSRVVRSSPAGPPIFRARVPGAPE